MIENVPYECLHMCIRQPIEHVAPVPPSRHEFFLQQDPQPLRRRGHFGVRQLRDLRDLMLPTEEQLENSQTGRIASSSKHSRGPIDNRLRNHVSIFIIHDFMKCEFNGYRDISPIRI